MRQRTFKKLWDKWDELPDVRMRYGHGETGWGKDLGDGTVAVANQPLEEGLMFMDIVRLEDSGSPPSVAKVVQRIFSKQTVIRYPKGSSEQNKKWYKDIGLALRDQGFPTEGWTSGMCSVAHTDDVDPKEILKDALVDVSQLKFETESRPQPS